jgi:predicted transcriptional regulator
MKVLLSIKPEYAMKIFNGEKKYEFRRSIFKDPDITSVVVYASSPLKMVLGEFEIEKILFDNINSLWNETKDHGGISEDKYFKYFENKEKGYAIQIKNFIEYNDPYDIEEKFNIKPPQSYAYIK